MDKAMLTRAATFSVTHPPLMDGLDIVVVRNVGGANIHILWGLNNGDMECNNTLLKIQFLAFLM